MTYNLFMLVMLFKGGNSEPLPIKSLILLHKIASLIIVNVLSNKEFEYATKEYLECITYSLVKLLKTEMLEGMGPSRPLAWISLLKIQLQCVRLHLKVLLEEI